MSLTLLPPAQKKPRPNYLPLYFNAFMRTEGDFCGDDTSAEAIQRSVYYGVRAPNLYSRKPTNEHDDYALNSLYRLVMGRIELLTPRQLMRVFPVDKRYDGKRWECKDYFYTMNALEQHGMDKPLGDRAFGILYDYTNPHVSNFTVGMMCMLDRLRLAQGEKGMLESFFESQGQHLTTYSRVEQNGKEYMRNNDTGEMARVARPKPRYLRVVRG